MIRTKNLKFYNKFNFFNNQFMQIIINSMKFFKYYHLLYHL